MNPVDKVLLGAGAALVLVIGAIFVWLSLDNAHLKTEVAQLQANATACRLANDEFMSVTARQNKAVARLQAAGRLREKRAQDAAYEAQKTMRAYYLAAEKLNASVPHGDSCKAAEDLLDTYLKDAS